MKACAHQTREKILELLAARHPRPDVPTQITPVTLPAIPMNDLHAPGRVDSGSQLSAAVQRANGLDSKTTSLEGPRARIFPTAPERYAAQFTMPGTMHQKLQRFRGLAAHRVPSGDIAALLELALDFGIAALEKRKFATTDKPRAPKLPKAGSRHIPADAKRKVRDRDGGRCAFVSDDGHRCEENHRLEFDHVVPLAKGGASTVDNLRLLCRAHNQHAAEQEMGKGFMEGKRTASRLGGTRPAAEAASSTRWEPHEPDAAAIAAAREAQVKLAELWGPRTLG